MADGLGVRARVVTDAGRRRPTNEDWCGVLEPDGPVRRERDGWVYVVADGVGAYGTGEEASRVAGDTILESYRQWSHLDPASRLQAAVEAGNRAVWECRRRYIRQGQTRPVMTTVLAALVVDDRALLANVGDCRAYLIRAGVLTQLTVDHTWVGEQVARGTMTAEQARDHPRSHVITRALGQGPTVDVDLRELQLWPGDRLILCSDGLTRHLEDREILAQASSAPVDVATLTMLDVANRRGGEDNITVGVLEVVGARRVAGARQATDERAASSPDAHASSRPTDREPRRPVPSGDSALPDTGPPAWQAPATPAMTPATMEEPGHDPPRTADGSANRRDHLAALLAIGLRISSSLDLDETLESIVDSLVEVTGGERGFIMLWDEAADGLVYSIGRNVDAPERRAPEFSRTIVESVFKTGAPILVGDALADAQLGRHDSVVAQSLRSVLCVPLEVKGERIGIVYVDSRIGADIFTDDDLELLRAFAAQAATALENARLYDQLKHHMDENATMRASHENVLRSLNSAIISLDADGRVVLINRAAEGLFGVAARFASGRPLQELLPASLHRTFAALAAGDGDDAGDPDGVQVEVRLPHRGRVALAVKALPLVAADGRSIGSVLIADDVTHQRLLAEARQREATEKERIGAIFGRFLAPALVEQLMNDPGMVQLGGVRREVTVLFADIRGFTGLAERRSPEEVVAVLNSYLACATEIILGVGGTLDKFLGDGVMAFFNAPLPQEDHVLAAVRAATLMQDRLRELRPSGQRIAFGVGINTGEAIVGNIGTAELMNYTIIGDVVNVAARLQNEARAGEVLLSGSTYERIADAVEAEELGAVHVKGRAEPVHIYKVLRVLT